MATTVKPGGKRGWVKWAILAVCLVVTIPAGCTYWLYRTITQVLATSKPASLALERAQAHPAVTEKLGHPLVVVPPAQGSLKVDNFDGSASITMRVRGPRGTGRLHLKATRTQGQWRLDQLDMVPDDGGASIVVIGAGLRT